jgi:hypothetical protein
MLTFSSIPFPFWRDQILWWWHVQLKFTFTLAARTRLLFCFCESELHCAQIKKSILMSQYFNSMQHEWRARSVYSLMALESVICAAANNWRVLCALCENAPRRLSPHDVLLVALSLTVAGKKLTVPACIIFFTCSFAAHCNQRETIAISARPCECRALVAIHVYHAWRRKYTHCHTRRHYLWK